MPVILYDSTYPKDCRISRQHLLPRSTMLHRSPPFPFIGARAGTGPRSWGPPIGRGPTVCP